MTRKDKAALPPPTLGSTLEGDMHQHEYRGDPTKPPPPQNPLRDHGSREPMQGEIASPPRNEHRHKKSLALPTLARKTTFTYHQIHPLPLLPLGHPRVSLGGDVIERLLEEVEINPLSFLLPHEEVALLEPRRDGGDAPRVFPSDEFVVLRGHGVLWKRTE